MGITQITFGWEAGGFRLVVDGLHIKEAQLLPNDQLSDLQPPIYLGSMPASILSSHQVASFHHPVAVTNVKLSNV